MSCRRKSRRKPGEIRHAKVLRNLCTEHEWRVSDDHVEPPGGDLLIIYGKHFWEFQFPVKRHHPLRPIVQRMDRLVHLSVHRNETLFLEIGLYTSQQLLSRFFTLLRLLG